MNKSILMKKLLDMGGIKEIEDSFIEVPGYLTGFNGFDFYSSTLKTGIQGFPVINGGYFPRLTNIVGESGSGKTTFAVQTIASTVDRLQRKFGSGFSEFFFYDPEQNTSSTRITKLTGWNNQELVGKCIFNQKNVSLLELANFIIKLADTKKRYKKELMIPTGIKDILGNEVIVLAPTFILIDSVAAVNPSGIESLVAYDKSGDVKEVSRLATNMDGATDAKAWTIFIRKMKPFLDEANINLTLINHKTMGIQTDMFKMPTRVLPFLKPGERLKGGNEIIYQSYMIIDLASKEKYDQVKNPIYGPYVDGFGVQTTFVKNKNNVEGVSFPMVFDKSSGFLPELGDFESLFQDKWGFSGSPMSMSLDILPEIKFTRKTLYSKCQEYPLLSRALSFTTKINMGYKTLFNSTPPDLSNIGESRSLEDRVALVTSFTDTYPGYIDRGIDIPEELRKISIENRRYFMSNVDFDLTDSIPTYDDIDLMSPDEEMEDTYASFTDQTYDPYSETEELDGVKYTSFIDS